MPCSSTPWSFTNPNRVLSQSFSHPGHTHGLPLLLSLCFSPHHHLQRTWGWAEGTVLIHPPQRWASPCSSMSSVGSFSRHSPPFPIKADHLCKPKPSHLLWLRFFRWSNLQQSLWEAADRRPPYGSASKLLLGHRAWEWCRACRSLGPPSASPAPGAGGGTALLRAESSPGPHTEDLPAC